ncbi:hypothetical protein Tco_0885099 [Tanacetum coccineum]
MSSPKFAKMHNVVAFLEKPAESDGFAEIIDFLKASSVSYALTINPIIYTLCIQQFWATAQVKTVNGVRQLQALIDKKKVIITEASIRNDLYLNDAEVFINQQLGDMSHHKKTFVNPFHTKKIFANMKREGKDFSRRVTPLFDSMLVQASEEKQKSRRKQRKEAEIANAETEEEEYLNTPSNDPLPSEKAKSDQAIEIASLKKRVNNLEKRRQLRTTGHKRFKKLDAEVTLVNEQQNEDLMFDTRVLDDDEVFVDVATSEKDEQSIKLDDSTTGEAVTTASVEDSVAPTIQVSTADIGEVTAAKIDELTLAQTLIEIKAAKPKVVTTAATTTTTTRPKGKGVVVQEPSEFRVPQESQPSISKDKGKGIMVEPEVPLKRKDQIALDEQIARDIQAKLDAELEEEHKLARKQEEEANIALIESWENTQAMMEADRLLAERLQSKEREELTDEEKGKLFMELMEKRRKHFAALRAQEKRNRPPTKAQKRTQMSTYLKHMGGYTYKQLKGKNFDEIQKLFDKEMKRVNTFVAMGSEERESKEKKAKGSEETAKGSRKKMLGRKRVGK